ncbi:MAG: YihA family ribosome biogenesis GTP-binding protein [Ruminococcaceae bacterium]|nr:YihA family ribosome biogenesis GTP-binding protein [Oscillospiraceae bacterium]
MNLNKADIFFTAGKASQLPGKLDLSMPQIAMCGRSNVGKSSMINKLLNRKSLARVSGEPGKTITVNAYNVDDTIYLVDLPGYGYAKRSFDDREKWKQFIEKYFSLDANILFLLLIDLKVGLTKDDDVMLQYLVDSELPFAIVTTKSDKLNKTNREKCIENILSHKGIPADTAIIPFSSKTGEGVKDVWEIIEEFCEFVKNAQQEQEEN